MWTWIKVAGRALINLGVVVLGIVAAKELVDAGSEYFKDKDLYDLRDELVRTYGDRRRRNGNGPGMSSDPQRAGCL
jgi:hypothetical protein